jgi:hypothetical protein
MEEKNFLKWSDDNASVSVCFDGEEVGPFTTKDAVIVAVSDLIKKGKIAASEWDRFRDEIKTAQGICWEVNDPKKPGAESPEGAMLKLLGVILGGSPSGGMLIIELYTVRTNTVSEGNKNDEQGDQKA